MANTYSDLVKRTFNTKRQELGQTIGAEKGARLASTRQSNLAGGISGPISTALEQRAQRQVGEEGARALTGLMGQEASQQVSAEQMDRQQAQQEKIAEQQFWSGIWQGLGTLLSPVATAGITKVAEELFPTTGMTDAELDAETTKFLSELG